MRTLHLISHTHWDREWYQTFQQFRLRLLHLIDHLLDILDTDPVYRHFMLDGQTIVLEDYLRIRPEREEALRRYIQEGRILIGPWYILPDEFLVSPEATIRNLLAGERITRRFGPKMLVGYIPDPFGHIGQMPQILRGFGIETASVQRGLSDEPCELWWEAPDGSRVLMSYLRDGYGNAAGILNGGAAGFVDAARGLRESLAPHSAAGHLLLMHGTDHMEPQDETSQAVAAAQDRLDGDCLVHSTLPAYFSALRASTALDLLPVVTGELRSSKRHPLLPGVLSSRMWIKQRNRACETLLEKWAEPVSAWAEMISGSSPAGRLRHPSEALREAWRLLMECHPHDSICGCSIDAVHEEMRPRFDQVEQLAGEIVRQGMETLAGAVHTRAPFAAVSAVIVFNPTGGPRTDLVEVEVDTLPESGLFDLVDDTGAPIPYQTTGLGASGVFNVSLNPSEFRESFRMVSDGVLMGLRVRELSVQKEGSQVFINAVVSEKGEPDGKAWENGRQAIEALIADPSVAIFHARAISAEKIRLLFAAPEVPSYGYRTFWVREKLPETRKALRVSPLMKAMLPVVAKIAAHPAGQRLMTRLSAAPGSKPPYRIENERLLVELRPDGTLEMTDKATGTIYAGQNRFIDGGDRGDSYNYSPPEKDRFKTARLRHARVYTGPAVQTLEYALDLITPDGLSTSRKTRSSRLVIQHITCKARLSHGIPRLDIETQVENRARDHRLRVHFPAPFSIDTAETDGHFEVNNRRFGLPAFDDSWVEKPRPEVPQRAFTRITDGKNGLLIANRGLPEVEVVRREDGRAEIALTLLRCTGDLSRDDFPDRRGHAGPAEETPGGQMLGSWAFAYAVIPHDAAGWTGAFRQAWSFEAPFRGLPAALQDGTLPAKASFLDVRPEHFVISAIKAAEDGHGWLARGYNLTGETIEVTMRPLLPYHSATLVNLAEEPLQELAPGTDGAIGFLAGGHAIITVRFE